MQFYSGPPIHFLSGVDSRAVGILLSSDSNAYPLIFFNVESGPALGRAL